MQCLRTMFRITARYNCHPFSVILWSSLNWINIYTPRWICTSYHYRLPVIELELRVWHDIQRLLLTGGNRTQNLQYIRIENTIVTRRRLTVRGCDSVFHVAVECSPPISNRTRRSVSFAPVTSTHRENIPRTMHVRITYSPTVPIIVHC